MTFSSLAAPKVVMVTTFGVVNDENFVKLTAYFSVWNYKSTKSWSYDHNKTKPDKTVCNDDVIKWKHFSCYWSFVREFTGHRPVMRSFDVFFDVRLKQQMSKQWRRRLFETPSRSLWRHCNAFHFSWDNPPSESGRTGPLPLPPPPPLPLLIWMKVKLSMNK